MIGDAHREQVFSREEACSLWASDKELLLLELYAHEAHLHVLRGF